MISTTLIISFLSIALVISIGLFMLAIYNYKKHTKNTESAIVFANKCMTDYKTISDTLVELYSTLLHEHGIDISEHLLENLEDTKIHESFSEYVLKVKMSNILDELKNK
jgi:hypothetical protein